jgi:hypothetical protein
MADIKHKVFFLGAFAILRKVTIILSGIDIYMSKADYIIVWRCVPYRQIVTSELVWLVFALTLEHVT